MQDQLYSLSSRVLGVPVNPDYRPPSSYTGEKFGIEYLFSKFQGSGNNFATTFENFDSKIEEIEDSFLTDEEVNCV